MLRRYCLALLVWLPLGAQTLSTTGSIQGRITDQSGSPVSAVRVTAAQTSGGSARTAESGSQGEFRISGLAIGNYTLRLEKDGFATAQVAEFSVSVGQTVQHRLTMQLAQLNQRLDVQERPEAVDATATSASAALGGERIEESPAPNRNFLNFVLVAPGVAPSAGSNAQRTFAGQRSAAADSGFSFGGLRGRNNSLLIDGMDNRDETTGGIRVGIGLEMVQEFRVSGTGVSAEFGGAAGGIVNVVTRSGTNLWHGDATFFSQTGALNARNPEIAAGPKASAHRHQPGVSINGPARKDRTFFSTALEQQWDANQEWSDAPASALAGINQALATPAFSRAAVKQATRGLFDTSAAGTEFSLKANHQAGQKHSLSSRYAFSRERDRGDVQGADNFADQSSRGDSLTRDHSWVASWMTISGPNLVHELRGQIARRGVDLTPSSRGAMLEIPGVLTIGQSYRLDGERTETHYQIANSLAWSTHRHQLSAGASLHWVRLRSRLANRFSGVYLFPTLERFLAASPDVYLQAFGQPDTRLPTAPAGFWVREKWQPHPNVTIEAGLRLDFQRLPAPLPSSGLNAAPRLGLAWRPTPKGPYVIRAGYGLFYDRYPLAFLNDALQKDGTHAVEQYLTGAAAVRAFQLGLGGGLGQPLPGFPLSAYTPALPFPTTHGQKLSAGMERAFGKDTTLSAEYSWVRGLHLPRIRNAALTLPAHYAIEQTASSLYHGVSVALNRRMSRELTFLLAYHAGRTRDDASDYDEHPLDPANLKLDWALSRQHQAHRFSASALFEFPFLEHLTVGPIFTYGCGRPLNGLLTTDAFRTGAYPVSARPPDTGRNAWFSPATTVLNLRLLKTFPVKEGRAVMQVGIEAFNLTNHSNPLRVSPYLPLSSFGQPMETLESRQLQLVLQFEY
ncbi:MAG: TonB-dependent receptor [Acidobacteriia bacterium]|nr:TonB-dependent receptor [Terriglobia bacterium]